MTARRGGRDGDDSDRLLPDPLAAHRLAVALRTHMAAVDAAVLAPTRRLAAMFAALPGFDVGRWLRERTARYQGMVDRAATAWASARDRAMQARAERVARRRARLVELVDRRTRPRRCRELIAALVKADVAPRRRRPSKNDVEARRDAYERARALAMTPRPVWVDGRRRVMCPADLPPARLDAWFAHTVQADLDGDRPRAPKGRKTPTPAAATLGRPLAGGLTRRGKAAPLGTGAHRHKEPATPRVRAPK